MSRLTRILAALTVVAVAAPAVAAVTDEDIDRARDEVNRIVAESQELGDAVQAAWARQAELEYEIDALQSSIEFARVELREIENRLEEVAVELYMGSTTAASISALFTVSDDEFEAGLQYLREVSGVDVDVVNQLRVFRRELNRQTDRLAEASEEQEVVTAELQEMAEDLQGDLIEAQAVYDQLVAQQAAEEEERRRQEEERRRREAEEAARQATSTSTTPIAASDDAAASPDEETSANAESEETTDSTAPATTTTTTPPSSGGACPVAGAVSFSDSWGAPRSGGRAHQGVDMIAARGTPIVAVYAGIITRISTGNLSGRSVWLRDSSGDAYFYAHLDGYGDISVGQAVPEGHVIGYNGSTGNAPDWLPHLHFEHHPGGGSAVNPYPLARSLCG